MGSLLNGQVRRLVWRSVTHYGVDHPVKVRLRSGQEIEVTTFVVHERDGIPPTVTTMGVSGRQRVVQQQFLDPEVETQILFELTGKKA